MPTTLDLDHFGDALGAAATVLHENARLAGLSAAVPTCPGWRVHDLVLHTGLVHRWATAILQGVPPDEAGEIDLPVSETVKQAAGFAGADAIEWYDAQVTVLLQTIVDTPDDAEVFFFLKDAPAPRLAWTRRQAHETAIHAVDAMSARLRRVPSVRELWLSAATAVDGVDELLTGFVPRRGTRLRSSTAYRLLVEAHDTGHAWLLEVSDEPVVTTALAAGAARPAADVRFAGDAVPLFLHLWNREPEGGELDCSDPDVLAQWRTALRIT